MDSWRTGLDREEEYFHHSNKPSNTKVMKQNERVSVSQARSCWVWYLIFMQKTQTNISQELGNCRREHLAVIVRP